MQFTLYRARTENYTPRDLMLAATRDTPSWRAYLPDGRLFLYDADGNLCAYHHWDIKHLDDGEVDQITVFLKPVTQTERG